MCTDRNCIRKAKEEIPLLLGGHIGLFREHPVRVTSPPEAARFLSESNLHNEDNRRQALGCEIYP